MNADTLEYLAELLRAVDLLPGGFKLCGTIEVYEENLNRLGTLRFNGNVESTFEAAS